MKAPRTKCKTTVFAVVLPASREAPTEKSEASHSRIIDAVIILVSERVTLDTILHGAYPLCC
jgi:hypothetical protein